MLRGVQDPSCPDVATTLRVCLTFLPSVCDVGVGEPKRRSLEMARPGESGTLFCTACQEAHPCYCSDHMHLQYARSLQS